MKRVLTMMVLLLAAAWALTARAAETPASASDAFRIAAPGYRYSFPRDHASHPDFRTEWWYYTGHLRAKDGRQFGYELTFFRVGIRRAKPEEKSAWKLTSVYMGHLAITDERGRRFIHRQTFARPALGMAGADPRRYRVWLYHWRAELDAQGRHQLKARTTQARMSTGGKTDKEAPLVQLELSLTSEKPPVIHGKQGVSVKAPGAGHASHYYSLTRLRTTGKLTIGKETLDVTGLSWMDHEFFTNQLAANQQGWDWYSLQLDDRSELMLYVMRRKDGSIESLSGGTYVRPDGKAVHLPLSAFSTSATGRWRSHVSGATYPSGWTVRVPSQRLDLKLTPTLRHQELYDSSPLALTYWEGAVTVTGSARGKPVRGRGYVELTGYAGAVPRM